MSVRDHPYLRPVLVVFLAAILGMGSSVTAQAPSLTHSVSTLDGQISVRLPQGWVARDAAGAFFSSVLAVGDTAESAQSVVSSLSGEGSTMTSARMNGFIAIITPQAIGGLPTNLALSTLLNAMIADSQSAGGRVLDQQSLYIGDQYPASIAVISAPSLQIKGIVGVFQAGLDIVEFSLGASPERSFDANQSMFAAIINSIRVPAEAEFVVQPTHAVATQVSEPTAVPVTLETFRSSDQRVSLDLPTEWTVTDQIAGQNVLAYGDSPQAAQSRLASARPDLAEKAAITGNGGLVILYPAAQFSVNPQSPNLGPLMKQALGQLKASGYTATDAKSLEGIDGGLYASIQGTEVGYLALIPFGDQIAYVTSTGVSSTAAQASDKALFAILGSVRVPAAPESTGGLGGLGGLGGSTNPTPTAPPLGGLALPTSAPAAAA